MREHRAGRLRSAVMILLAVLIICCIAAAVIILLLNRPASDADRVRELHDRLAESNIVWHDLDDLWRRVEAGEVVHCSAEPLPRPYFIGMPGDDPAHSGIDHAAHQLNATIRQLHSVADSWAEICQGDIPMIEPQHVEEGRAILTEVALGLRDIADTLKRYDPMLTEAAAPG